MRIILSLTFFIAFIPSLFGQDLLSDNGVITGNASLYTKKVDEKFPIGQYKIKSVTESDSLFASKIFINGVERHHEIISLTKWKNTFGIPIVTFGKFYMDKEETEAIIVGLLFNPVGTNTYQVNKICELSSGCGDLDASEIKSVFYFNNQLCILWKEDCQDKWVGDFNTVYIYSNKIVNNKLELIKNLQERCDYTSIIDDKGEEIDIYIGGGEENIKYRPCKFDTYKGVIQELKK